MSAGTRIEWADHTFNPWWGCTKVSPGCDNCYAETLSQRFGDDVWGHGKQRKIASETTWKQPYSWDRQASKAGTRARVFCASMSDVLEGGDALDAARRRLWALIEDTPNLDWMLLTKRPHRIKRDIPWTTNWPDNVWMGVSVEDQEWADKRIPHLADCGAQVKFLSAEPLLEELDIGNYSFDIHWVIAGGESGPMARHSLPSNFARLRDQCARFGIPFLFKQWGEWAPSVHDGITVVTRVGKKKAGRLLDGLEHNGFPESRGLCQTSLL